MFIGENVKPQMKRDHYGGADWVETQKAVLQNMMLREFGWERFYKGSNPRGKSSLVGLPQGERGRDGKGRGTET